MNATCYGVVKRGEGDEEGKGGGWAYIKSATPCRNLIIHTKSKRHKIRLKLGEGCDLLVGFFF